MQDYFTFIFGSINRLLNQNASLFETMGRNLFFGFAAIVLCWYGIRSALSSASGGSGFNWTRFIDLLQELVVVYAILTFYTVPLPLVGVSFTHLILDQVQHMVAALNQSRIQELFNALNGVEKNLPFPSPLELLQVLRVMTVLVCIIVAQAVTLYVIMYGYVATAVIMLLGPVFIPFKIFPQMDWLFWGWLKAFIQYAFYQVIASAYVFVFSDFLLQFLGAKNSPLSSGEFGILFVPLVLTLVTFTLATIKIPALTFSIFSGRSGDYVIGRWR